MYKLSPKAVIDLSEIADYTINKFGIAQAKRYRDGFKKSFLTLAKNEYLGRSASKFSKNLRCFPYKSHTIFYIPEDGAVLIIRVLGQSMDFKKHLETG